MSYQLEPDVAFDFSAAAAVPNEETAIPKSSAVTSVFAIFIRKRGGKITCSPPILTESAFFEIPFSENPDKIAGRTYRSRYPFRMKLFFSIAANALILFSIAYFVPDVQAA